MSSLPSFPLALISELIMLSGLALELVSLHVCQRHGTLCVCVHELICTCVYRTL